MTSADDSVFARIIADVCHATHQRASKPCSKKSRKSRFHRTIWAFATETSLAFRSRGAGKVILPRARVEFFDPLNLARSLPAQSAFLRFRHSPCAFQFGQGFVDGAQCNVHDLRSLAHGDSGCLHGGLRCRPDFATDPSHEG